MKTLTSFAKAFIVIATVSQTSAFAETLDGDAREKAVASTSVHSENGSRKFALTLSGGGARGAAHVGVLKVLEREGLRPDFVCGNSIGAMIGGLYASGVPVSEIERLVLSKEFHKAFFPVNRKVQVVTYGLRYAMARSVLLHPQIGLYSGKSLSAFVERNLPKAVVNIEDAPITFAASAVDLLTTKEVWLSKGNLSQAIRASNSVPGFYRPLKVGEHVLVDGALRSNMPTEIAEAEGAPMVVAVRLQAYLEVVDQKQYDTVLDYGDRLTSILLAGTETKGLGETDVLIAPKLPYMRTTSYKKKDLENAIKEGEIAAQKMLPQIYEARRHKAALN